MVALVSVPTALLYVWDLVGINANTVGTAVGGARAPWVPVGAHGADVNSQHRGDSPGFSSSALDSFPSLGPGVGDSLAPSVGSGCWRWRHARSTQL